MSVDPNQSAKKPETDNPWGYAFSVGWELVACAVGGFLAGQWLDKKLKTSPWLMLVGSLFGISVALYRLVKLSNERLKRR